MSSAILRQADFPAAWKSNGVTSSNSAQTAKVAASIPSCAPFVAQAAIDKKQLNQESDTFVNTTMTGSSQNEIANSAVGYGSEDLAKTAYTAFASAATESCLQNVFDKEISQSAADLKASSGLTASVTASVQRTGVPAVGDATTAYSITLEIKAGTIDEQVGFYLQLVRVGPYVVTYDATLYASNTKGFGQSLVDTTINRLNAAIKAQ
jgi:hypothetical protein